MWCSHYGKALLRLSEPRKLSTGVGSGAQSSATRRQVAELSRGLIPTTALHHRSKALFGVSLKSAKSGNLDSILDAKQSGRQLQVGFSTLCSAKLSTGLLVAFGLLNDFHFAADLERKPGALTRRDARRLHWM